MAIYQPVNITPDLVDGPENGVVFVNPGGNVVLSWKVSGSSPLVAYRVEFFKNDANSTAGTDTGKVTVSPAFYPVDSDGNETRFSVSLPYGSSGTYFSIAESDANKQGKIRITQYWGAGNSQKVVQRTLSVYRITERTTVSLAYPTGYGGFKTFTATITLPSYATYGECSVLWKRWQVYTFDESELVQDTGKIWGASPDTWTTSQLFPGKYYAILTVATSNGEEIQAVVSPFTSMLTPVEIDGPIKAVCDRANGAVRVIAQAMECVDGDVYDSVYDSDSNSLLMPGPPRNGYGIWDIPAFSSENWGMIWEGRVTATKDPVFRLTQQNGNVYSLGRTLTSPYSVSIVPSITFNLPGTDTLPTSRLRLVIIRIDDTTIQVHLGTYDSNDNYSASGWNIITQDQTPPVKLELLSGSRTYQFAVFYGFDGMLDLKNAAETGDPTEFTGPQIYLDGYAREICLQYFGESYTGGIWRNEAGSSELMEIAAFNSSGSLGYYAEYLDFSAGNGKEYNYSIITQQSENATPVITTSEAITPCFWDWALIEAEESQSEDLGDFIALNVFFFGKNFQSGSDGNGSSPGVYSTFTRFPVVMRDTQNRHSGVLSSLIGVMTGPGEYTDDNGTRDLLRALSTSSHPLFLRSRRGDFFRVAISGEIMTVVQDNTVKQVITASVPWVEVGPVTGSVMKNVTPSPLE